MDLIPIQPIPARPLRPYARLRGLLIGVAVAIAIFFVIAAGYVALLLLTFDSTGWM